jgi:hypothetical protein
MWWVPDISDTIQDLTWDDNDGGISCNHQPDVMSDNRRLSTGTLMVSQDNTAQIGHDYVIQSVSDMHGHENEY